MYIHGIIYIFSMHARTYAHTCAHTHTNAYAYVYAYTYVYVNVYAYVYAYVYASAYGYAYVYGRFHVYARGSKTRGGMLGQIYACVCVYVPIRTNLHIVSSQHSFLPMAQAWNRAPHAVLVPIYYNSVRILHA